MGKLLDSRTTRALKMLGEPGQILQLTPDAGQRSVYECFLYNILQLVAQNYTGLKPENDFAE
jgi:hypothetical protein